MSLMVKEGQEHMGKDLLCGPESAVLSTIFHAPYPWRPARDSVVVCVHAGVGRQYVSDTSQVVLDMILSCGSSSDMCSLSFWVLVRLVVIGLPVLLWYHGTCR